MIEYGSAWLLKEGKQIFLDPHYFTWNDVFGTAVKLDKPCVLIALDVFEKSVCVLWAGRKYLIKRNTFDHCLEQLP